MGCADRYICVRDASYRESHIHDQLLLLRFAIPTADIIYAEAILLRENEWQLLVGFESSVLMVSSMTCGYIYNVTAA